MKQDEKIIDACAGDVKRRLDRDKDGNITKEEFINNARFMITSLNYTWVQVRRMRFLESGILDYLFLKMIF